MDRRAVLNARMVQVVFDDLNLATPSMLEFRDRPFDAERTTRPFIAAMPSRRSAGPSPSPSTSRAAARRATLSEQPWHNSGSAADGRLRPDYAARMHRIIERADEFGWRDPGRSTSVRISA